MLKQRVFQIAVIFAAFMIINLTVHSGERCNRPTDVDSSIGANTGAYGHAEVVGVGWWESDNNWHYAGISVWGYVENLFGFGAIGATIKCQFWVVELTEDFDYKAQWYAMPIFEISAQIDPCECFMPSNHLDALSFRGGDWLEGKIARAETSITVQATAAGRRGAQQTDEWFAWGCVDKEFPDLN